MKVALVLVLFVALALAVPIISHDRDVLDRNMVDAINSKQSAWKAGFNPRFAGVKLREFKKMLGVHENVHVAHNEVSEVKAVPDTFDSRTQWPGCIGPVLDQGHCGSCWAFGAVETLYDRTCIQSKGATKVVLSEQDLVSCDSSNNGCNGGQPLSAWQYLTKIGTVSEKCYPYEMGNCTHPGCSDWPTPKCKKECADGSPFKNDRHYAASAYSVASNAAAIQTEIYTHGPVEVAFAVYEDFAHYQSGVYSHTTGSLLGFHAVKNIGWGVENNTAFWLIQNSWNEGWGEKGYFKIKRGVNECGIETGATAGLAKV